MEWLRPGAELIQELGGVQSFMGFDGAVLTDSGGYQAMSLAAINSIDESGIRFRSHIDGALLDLTPEKAVAIQENLGADIAMCLDECPPSDTEPAYLREAVMNRLPALRIDQQADFVIVNG